MINWIALRLLLLLLSIDMLFPSNRQVCTAESPFLHFSFDSDRFEFKEFVDQGVQCTELAAVVVDKEKEGLVDTVTAYEMQNKFLNKEVLELNQLRQQAAEREQKLFM